MSTNFKFSSAMPIRQPASSAVNSGFLAHHGIWAPGVRLFRQLRFSAKAMIISMAFMLPMLTLLGWQLTVQSNDSMEARLNATRQHVEVAHSVLVWAQAQEAAGTMARAQAQKLALQLVSQMRYDGAEYFWINDMEPRMLMHPITPDLEGREVGDLKDSNGFALFQGFVDEVRKHGKGSVAYLWPKPGSASPVNKVAYVQGFEPWGWVIGSGVYTGDLQQGARRELLLSCGVVAAALLMAGYLFLSFYRVLDGGLKETCRHLAAIAGGDLSTTPSPWGSDEAAQLMLVLRHMQESLRGMVQRVRSSSDDIVHASSAIANGAIVLSSRTEQAAANLEEAAASMEQISATVKITTESTLEVSRVARRNAEVASDGGRVMREVVGTMDGIRNASARIGEIIGTIDSIAFQTNILALNAAVEAARAGKQGRGFAVVASEVRLLALRSAEAAREIKTLVGNSVQQVEAGSHIVRKAGDAIEEIVASSQRVNQLLGQVTTGASEQSLAISQIGQAVQELDRMTQKNAALVEQTAAASSAMNEQAHSLAEEVARFVMPPEPKLPR